MRIDWSLVFTLVAAIFLATVVNRVFLSNKAAGSVVAVTEPSSVEEYVKRHYPTAT